MNAIIVSLMAGGESFHEDPNAFTPVLSTDKRKGNDGEIGTNHLLGFRRKEEKICMKNSESGSDDISVQSYNECLPESLPLNSIIDSKTLSAIHSKEKGKRETNVNNLLS